MAILRTKWFSLSILALVLLLCASSGVFAQEPADIPKDAPAPEQYPDADAVIMVDDIRYTVNADGSTSQMEHEIIRILNKDGLDRFAKVYRTYVVPGQDYTVEMARIIKPDGTVTSLDPQKEILREAKFAESSPVYKNLMVLTLDFSKAEINDIIQFKLINTDKSGIIKNNFWSVSFIEDEIPMLETRFYVTMHRDADKLRWLAVGKNAEGVTPEKKTLADGVEYSWILRDRKAVPDEPSSPGFRDRVSYIMVSTAPSWEALSQVYWKVFEPFVQPDPTVKAKVAELTRNLKEPGARINALAAFVRNKKSIGIGFSPDNLLLNKPAELLKSEALTKFDATLLYVAMLRAAGFEAYPALATDSKYGSVARGLASPFQFNNLVAAVKLNNTWRYIDPSHVYGEAMGMQTTIEGQELLVLQPKGSQLAAVPVSPPEQNMEEMKAKAILSQDGSIGVTLLLKETGSRKLFWDAFLSLLEGPEARGAIFGKLVQVISPEARLLGSESDENEADNTLNVELNFMVDEYPVVSGNYWIVKLPLLPAQKMEFSSQDPAKRQLPVVLGSTSKEIKTMELTIPDGFAVKSLPSDINYSNNVGSLVVKSRQEGNTIFYEYTFAAQKTTIPVAEFKDLQELYNKAYKAGSEVILLERTSTPAQG